MAPDYFDSTVEFPELDPMTGLPVGTAPSARSASEDLPDWQSAFSDSGALGTGVFANPMDIATQEENKKLRAQLEEMRSQADKAAEEYRAQQDKYVEALRQDATTYEQAESKAHQIGTTRKS